MLLAIVACDTVNKLYHTVATSTSSQLQESMMGANRRCFRRYYRLVLWKRYHVYQQALEGTYHQVRWRFTPRSSKAHVYMALLATGNYQHVRNAA